MKALLLLVLLTGCLDSPHDAPLVHHWQASQFPLPIAIRDGLDNCQRTSIEHAVTWWHEQTKRALFRITHESALERGINIVPDPSTPGRHSFAWRWAPGQRVKAFEIRLRRCTNGDRTATHSLGHALGLGHSSDPSHVMAPHDVGYAWALSYSERWQVVGQLD